MDLGTFEDAVGLAFTFVVFGVPALAIAARLAIRPIVDAIVRLRESFITPGEAVPNARIVALEAEVRRLSAEVQRLSETHAFDRELVRGTPAQALPANTDHDSGTRA